MMGKLILIILLAMCFSGSKVFAFGFVTRAEMGAPGSVTGLVPSYPGGPGFSVFESAVFFGVGVGYSDQNLSSSRISSYGGFGWQVEGGYDLSFFEDFGLRTGVFYSSYGLENRGNVATKGVESSSTKQYGVTSGLGYRSFILGAGIGKTSASIDTFFVSSASAKSEYSGTTKFLFSSFNVLSGKTIGTQLTARYGLGDLLSVNQPLIALKSLSFLLSLSMVFQVM